jgi:hypothetical protein
MSLDITLMVVKPVEVHNTNITHNLSKMAEAAILYKPLWRPEELCIQWAYELAPLLEQGISTLEADPDYFRQYNPENGWGDYDVFVSSLKNLLQACKENPDAKVECCR